MIDEATYEETLRKPWPTPTCAQCAGQCEAGKPCPIPTDFGDLDEDRHSTEGGAIFSVGLCLVLLAVVGFVWWKATHGSVL